MLKLTFHLLRRLNLLRDWRLVAQSGVFDPGFYLAQNPDVARAGINPLRHYLTRGAAEGRNPHSLFDGSWYLQQNPDIASRGINPLVHYLSCGWKEGRSPHPLFDIRFYLTQSSASTTEPVGHYICEGAAKGFDPCELFDSSFYLEQYPEVAQSGLNPLFHYLSQGVIKGCNPNPLFDTLYYLKRYPDIAATGINPLVHFVSRGALEGRMPNPLFDPLFYNKANPEVMGEKINPLTHYLRRGGAEKGCNPSPLFNTVRYISKHSELKGSGVNPLAHLLQHQKQPDQHSQDRPEKKCVATRRIVAKPKNVDHILASNNDDLDSSTNSTADLLVDLTTSGSAVIREVLAFLCRSRLDEVVGVVTVLLPQGIVDVDISTPAGWRLIPTSRPILAANEALMNASDAGHHFLIMLGPVFPESDSIRALTEAFKLDPHFGITMGRESAGGILALRSEWHDPEPISMGRDVLDCLPEFYILPEMLTPCFVVRDVLVANLSALDESYKSLAGALLEYLCHARRCGFRCIVLNQVIIANPHKTEVDIIECDILKLATEHPSITQAKVEFIQHPLHLHEGLLANAVCFDVSVRRSLLIDVTNLSNVINGTAEAVLGFCDGLLHANHDWVVTLLATEGPLQFHKLAERYSSWRIISPGDRGHFTVALSPSQPWTIGAMVALHRMALFNFYTMLDTIAWDIFPAIKGLDATWNFLSKYADGIFYISQYTRAHFATRFPSSQSTPACVSYLSFNPVDYRGASDDVDLHGDGKFILLVGNHYDHKHLRPTVDLLTSAFPLQLMKALGLTTHPNPYVEAIESGQISQTEIDRLFARAQVVVFPSFYEGFGIPVLRGLSYGRTVVARSSALLGEIAANYRGPGRLVAFRSETELVAVIGRILRGSEVPELALGSALQDSEQAMDWKDSATRVIRFIEEQIKNLEKSRWPDREQVIRQWTAHAE